MTVQTPQQVPGLTRIDLQQHNLSIPNYQVIQNRVELGPEAPAIRHKHPAPQAVTEVITAAVAAT
jgi:hypothetical protein